MDINYFKAIQGAAGADSAQEVLIRETKENLALGMASSIGSAELKRNGEKQSFIISQTDVRHKYEITAYPDEELYVGDVIDYMDEKWIVIETRIGSPLQKTGLMWLCNINLSFQNGTHDIITRPAVLDSGVYSTTKNGNAELQYVDKQFKLYLPYDDDTKKIFVDKRIAVDTRYDKHGQEILEVYDVTGINRIANNFGTGSHLLVCELRSGVYSKEHDNIEFLICDYIVFNSKNKKDVKVPCEIIGRKTIKIGTKKTYISKFSDDEAVAHWTYSAPSGVECSVVSNDISISVEDNDDLIGQLIQLTLTDENNAYKSCSMEIEVTA